MCVLTMCVLCSWRPEEDVVSSGLGVTDCEPPGVAGN